MKKGQTKKSLAEAVKAAADKQQYIAEKAKTIAEKEAAGKEVAEKEAQETTKAGAEKEAAERKAAAKEVMEQVVKESSGVSVEEIKAAIKKNPFGPIAIQAASTFMAAITITEKQIPKPEPLPADATKEAQQVFHYKMRVWNKYKDMLTYFYRIGYCDGMRHQEVVDFIIHNA